MQRAWLSAILWWSLKKLEKNLIFPLHAMETENVRNELETSRIPSHMH